MADKVKETGTGTHTATRRGYAAGRIIEAGEIVPDGIAVAEEWMAPSNAAQAVE